MLNLQRNHLVCLRQLPKLPAVEHLCLSENAISSLGGLGALRNTPLRSLNLTRNPVTFTQDYRAQWGDKDLQDKFAQKWKASHYLTKNFWSFTHDQRPRFKTSPHTLVDM